MRILVVHSINQLTQGLHTLSPNRNALYVRYRTLRKKYNGTFLSDLCDSALN